MFLFLNCSAFVYCRVITGIRLVTKLSITYFEIQQGVLVNGTIDNTTVKWDDRVTKKLEDMEKNNQIPDYASSQLTELSYHNRILNLDDIMLPPGWAVVGKHFLFSFFYFPIFTEIFYFSNIVYI